MRHPFLVHHRNCRKRVQHWALTTRFGETSMARQPETRRRLTKLMVRLILDHADGERVPEREEMRHDF
jgi:hypothetical protein